MSSTETKLLTAEDVLDLDLANPWELVKGVVIEMTRPGFIHGLICNEIARRIGNWCAEFRSGFAICNDTGVITERDPDTVRGPDLFYISRQRMPEIPSEVRWIDVAPELCVEVISPSDRWTEMTSKIDEYLAAGVLEVWIVDPELKTVHVYSSRFPQKTLRTQDTLESPDVLPGFKCPVSDLFADC